MMDRTTEELLGRFLRGVHDAMSTESGEMKAALRDLVNWKPEDAPRPLPGYGISKKEMSAVPFVCETYLYGLLGKEDARSLLSRLKAVCRAAGVELESLYADEA